MQTRQGIATPLRAVLMRIFSQLQFFDTSFAKAVNQNQHLMQFMIKKNEVQAEKEEQENQEEESEMQAASEEIPE